MDNENNIKLAKEFKDIFENENLRKEAYKTIMGGLIPKGYKDINLDEIFDVNIKKNDDFS